MRTFQITGAHRDSGNEHEITVHARTRDEAYGVAADLGILVETCDEVDGTSPTGIDLRPVTTYMMAIQAEVQTLRAALPRMISKGVVYGLLTFWLIAVPVVLIVTGVLAALVAMHVQGE